MNSILNNSKNALILSISMILMTGILFYPKWTKPKTEATISWDVATYYNYLPAIFIYQDLKYCKYQTQIDSIYTPFENFKTAYIYKSTNKRVMQYTCGHAILMSPWFFMAHGFTSVFYPDLADGYSYPYQICLGLGMLFYICLGLVLLRKILLDYFSEKAVSMLLISYVFGTVFLNYASIDQAQSNSGIFFLYTLLIQKTRYFARNPCKLSGFLIGICAGLITLIRPTDVICVFIPLLWNVSNIESWRLKVQFFRENNKAYLMSILGFSILPPFQFIYWKYVTGDWFVYSYQDQGFSWLHPHIHEFLLSYTSGYLTYCPLMFLSFLGIYFLWKNRIQTYAVLTVIVLSLYITMAWDIWNYGWYSGRAMIQYFAIWAFLFTAFLEFILKNKFRKYVYCIILLLCIYFNIWWTYHLHQGKVQAMNLTSSQYWSNIGRW